jgi:hypothetical protein
MSDRWEIVRETGPGIVNYTVRWSPWGSMDRWVINRRVPSEAGLFQLWVMEGRGLSLLTTELTYYGGLRNTLREMIDELAPSGERHRKLIAGRECWFRYSLTPFREYLDNLESWFGRGDIALDDEKREILVHEVDSPRKFPLPPPDIKFITRKRMKDSDFGPPMPTPK